MNLLLLAAALPMLPGLTIDLGDDSIGAPITKLRWLGTVGELDEAGAGAAVWQALARGLRSRGGSLEGRDSGHHLPQLMEVQQALELELLFGLNAQALDRVQGLAPQLEQGGGALSRQHARWCRYLYAAAAAYLDAALPEEAARMTAQLSGCDAETLRGLPWGTDRLNALLEQAQPKGQGRIMIESSLPGARVWVNGRPAGLAPVRIEGLPAGRHRIELVAGARVDVQLVDVGAGDDKTLALGKDPALAVFRDGRLSAAEAQSLGRALARVGSSHGLLLWSAGSRLRALVLDLRGASLLEGESPQALSQTILRSLHRLSPIPAGGLRLDGLAVSVGAPKRSYAALRFTAAEGLDAPPQRLVDEMISYAAQLRGQPPETFRARVAARSNLRAWSAQGGRFWGRAAIGVAGGRDGKISPELALVIDRLQPVSSMKSTWFVVGLGISSLGISPRPAGDGWDPLAFPVTGISAYEAPVQERIRAEGFGLLGATLRLGLQRGAAEGNWRSELLAYGGWRRAQTRLIHDQFIGDVSENLRRTEAFAWDGWSVGASAALWRRVGDWWCGLSLRAEEVRFPAVELDLIIPGEASGLGLDLGLARRF